MSRAGRLALAVAVVAFGSDAWAEQTCSDAPDAETSGDLAALVQRLTVVLTDYPSLDEAWREQAPILCLSDQLFAEQGYFEPKTNRIVLNSQISQDFQLAILIHEVRHLQQFDGGSCPSVDYRMMDYIRARLALEADASAVGVYIAWQLREAGDPGPWDVLQNWPTHDDLVARFAETIAAGEDEVAAASATFAEWFARADRREIYTFAICSNYLDSLDREKVAAGKATLPNDYASRLCVLPDGRPYACTLPP